MSFTIFDIIILSIIAVSSILGIFSGAIKVILSFLGFFGSIVSAYYLVPYCQELLTRYITSELLLLIISGALSYILSLLIISITLHILYKLLMPFSAGLLADKIFGGIAGFIRGNIIALIIFIITSIITSGSYKKANNLYDIVAATTKDKYPNWLQKSLTMDYLDDLIIRITNIIPEKTLKSVTFFEDSFESDKLNSFNKLNIDKPDSSEIILQDEEFEDHLNQLMPKDNN